VSGVCRYPAGTLAWRDRGIAQCQGYAGTPQVLWQVSGNRGIAQALLSPINQDSGIAQCQGYAGTPQVLWHGEIEG